MSLPFGQIAEVVAAMGGGATILAIMQAVRAARDGARSRESEQAAAIRSEIDRARSRADDMEGRYDRSQASLKRWQRYAHLLELWIDAHASPPPVDLPPRPDDPPPPPGGPAATPAAT